MENKNSNLLLEVKGLKKYFPLQKNILGQPQMYLRAVDNVSFKLEAGKTIGVVGESGCGKTTLGRTILQLYDTTGGKTLYYGHLVDEFLPKYYIMGIHKLPSYKSKLEALKNKLNEDIFKFSEDVTLNEYDVILNNLKDSLDSIKGNASKTEEDNLKAKNLSKTIKTVSKIKEILEDACIISGGLILGDASLAKTLLLDKLKKEKDLNNLKALYEKQNSKLEVLKVKFDFSNYEEVLTESKAKLEELNAKEEKTEQDKKETKNLIKLCNTLEKIIELKKNIQVLKDNITLANTEYENAVSNIIELKQQMNLTPLYNDLESRIEEGLDLAKLTKKEMRSLRTEIQLIFQDPYSSLPPRMTVGSILKEPVKVHKIVEKDKIFEHVHQTMKKCGLQPQYYDRYPHEFSGGQRQRICIARALAVNPKLVICDEPVSALDVSIQAQIINLLKELQNDLGLTYVFISHDLSVVKYITDSIIVMYLGNMMEIGDTDDIFKNPLHPYTQALFSAVPNPDPDSKMQRIILKGDIPSPANPPKGCKFHTRCEKCMNVCKFKEPKYIQYSENHAVQCHLYDDEVMANLEKYDLEYQELERQKEQEALKMQEQTNKFKKFLSKFKKK